MNYREEAESLGMEQVRDLLLDVIQAHEAEGCPATDPGLPCWGNRANAIGYLMHSLGLGLHGNMPDVVKYLEDYDRRCRDRECGHRAAEGADR